MSKEGTPSFPGADKLHWVKTGKHYGVVLDSNIYKVVRLSDGIVAKSIEYGEYGCDGACEIMRKLEHGAAEIERRLRIQEHREQRSLKWQHFKGYLLDRVPPVFKRKDRL